MPDVPTDPDPQTRITELEERLARAESAPVRERGRHMADEQDAGKAYLQKRVNELEDRLTKAEVSRKEARREAAEHKGRISQVETEWQGKLQALQESYDTLDAEYQDFLGRSDQEFQKEDVEKAELRTQMEELRTRYEGNPDEKDKKIAELETTIKLDKVRAKFKDIEPDLADGFDLEAAWKLQEFDPAKVEDVEKFDAGELAKQWREARAGLFKPEGSGQTPAQGPTRKPALTVAAELPSRGGRDSGTGKVQYKQSDLAQPGWYVNNPSLHKALAEGNAERIEE
jgi:hypothetical protein